MSLLQKLNQRVHAALNHDFCPGMNRWVYWLKQPLACVTIVGFIALACGLLVNPHAWVVLGVTVLIGLLGIIWPWLAIRAIDCEIDFPRRRGREGEPVEIRVTVRNRWPFPVWGLSLRQGFGLRSEEENGIALACVGGWSKIEFVWRFRPGRRGIYPLEAPVIETGFPFGICHGLRLATCPGNLIIWPRSVSLTSMPDAVEMKPCEQRLAERHAGDFGDVLGTREFRTGDSLRRVHWGQSARYRRLIVTERQAPAACAIQLFVDVDTAAHDGDVVNGTLEQSLRIAASVCESLHAQHSLVECIIGSDSCLIGSSRAELQRALDLLAKVPFGGRQQPSRACRFHGPRWSSRILITTPQAFHHHLQHRHFSAGERFILVHQSGPKDSHEHVSCPCRPWLEVTAEEPLDRTLPSRWRRACHA